jgi:hypothetical protein
VLDELRLLGIGDVVDQAVVVRIAEHPRHRQPAKGRQVLGEERRRVDDARREREIRDSGLLVEEGRSVRWSPSWR